MKLSNIIVFLSVVIIAYSFVNYYLFIRGIQALTLAPTYKLIFKIIFIALFVSMFYKLFSVFFPILFPKLNTSEDSIIFKIGILFNWIGSFWLAAMLYFFLILIFFDLIRLINNFTNFYSNSIIINYDLIKLYLFSGTVLFVVSLLLYGFTNSNNIRITKLELNINKKANNLKSLNIMAISDIHLGSIIGRLKINQIATYANKIKPDIILFAGDVLDEEVKMDNNNMAIDAIKLLKAPLGVYAILGNHEYIRSISYAKEFYRQNDIPLIIDTAVLIDNSFYIAGRDDLSNRKRIELDEIINQINKELPVILLDHQPFDLKPAEKLGVDLQISGHTHRGQMFPFNLLTDKIFELSYGYKKKGNTHYYVSSGFGGWGPPVRIGTIPEVVNIILNFKD